VQPYAGALLLKKVPSSAQMPPFFLKCELESMQWLAQALL
jgi:hypothetical protein